MNEFINWIGIFGTIAFAVTAVLAVAPKGIDLFGAIVMGVITAVGGGTIRDMILGVPVFWSIDQYYIWIAVVASIIAFYSNSLFTRKSVAKSMLYIDALGVSLFGIEAVDKVFDLGFALPIAPVMLGVLTAIGGGLTRDVLAGRQTLLMSRELYAIPVLMGCIIYVGFLHYLPEYKLLGMIISILFIFAFRSAAITKDLTVPDWLVSKPKAN